jgi:hypothetical protein
VSRSIVASDFGCDFDLHIVSYEYFNFGLSSDV